MTRPIKFIARIVSEKRMVEVRQVQFTDGVFIYILDKENDMHLPKDVELLQYTWVNDRNGVEIYEWYLVKYIAWNWNQELQTFTNPVFYDVDFASFCLGNEHSFRALAIDDGKEVVWNVYENPLLVNQLSWEQSSTEHEYNFIN